MISEDSEGHTVQGKKRLMEGPVWKGKMIEFMFMFC